MTTNSLIVLCATLCFASFAWGMIWHFRRVGEPSRAMLATAVLAVLCGAAQIATLHSRQIRFSTAAVALYAVSAALFWWAVAVTRGKLAACGQKCVSRAVVENGPYRYIRHPFYTAYNLTWLAGLTATGWWPIAGTAIVMGALYEFSAREEERGFLESGLAYKRYKGRVGKYLPRIGVWWLKPHQ